MREIKVIANSQNKNEVYMSEANTFGELKAELLNKGYNVKDMDFKEGKSRIDLKDETSPLPSNFMYRGEETNDLVILITPRNTKIKSGMNRQEAYAKIKQYNLQSECVKKYGRNFTQCGTLDLVALVEKHEKNGSLNLGNAAKVAEKVTEKSTTTQKTTTATTLSTPGTITISKDALHEVVKDEITKMEGDYSVNSLAMMFLKLVDILEGITIMNHPLVPKSKIDNLRKAIRKDYQPYSEEELKEMQK